MGGERSKKNCFEMRRNYEALRGVEGRRLSRKGNAEALGIKNGKLSVWMPVLRGLGKSDRCVFFCNGLTALAWPGVYITTVECTEA